MAAETRTYVSATPAADCSKLARSQLCVAAMHVAAIPTGTGTHSIRRQLQEGVRRTSCVLDDTLVGELCGVLGASELGDVLGDVLGGIFGHAFGGERGGALHVW